MSSKKKLILDARVISKEKKSSDYKYSFSYEGLNFTVKQQSTEIFDLLINNIPFDNLMNQERQGRLRQPKRKAQPSSQYQQYPSSTSSSSSSSSYQRMKQDEEYARYLQNQYNKEALSSASYYQIGNYKKQPSSSAQYDGYKDEVVNYKNIDEMKQIQRSNQQSTETFQHNQNILSNIDNVFGETKKDSEVNVQHNMNILGNLDMDNILGNNNGNAGMFDLAKEGNNIQTTPFQNNQQQQRVGNVGGGGGFMDFNISGVNNNSNNYINSNSNNNQQVNMNNNQFGFDNNNNSNMNNFNIQQQPNNQMQFNYLNNNNNNNFQFDNKMNNIVNSNQNYLQQQQQNQMMPNPTNFISQPIQPPLSQDYNLNPNPSSFQTINQPQLTPPTHLMSDAEQNTFTQNPQQQQQQLYSQLNDPNPPIMTNPTSTNTNLFPMNNAQPQNDFKSKIMSTGLVNIDNLLGDSQSNANYTYNFNTSPLFLNNNPSTNAQPQPTSSPFDF